MLFKKRLQRPIVITGHPRCGTTSAASLCQRLSLDVGDEYVGAHGISSWMMAVDDRHNPYAGDELGRSRRNLAWDWLFLVVRDIKSAVPSVIVENEHAADSYAFRRKHIRKQLGIDLDDAPDALGKAILSLSCWSRIVLAQSPHFVFRIEDQQNEFRDFLVAHGVAPSAAATLDVNENVNARKPYAGVTYEKPHIAFDVWGRLGSDLKDHVTWYSQQFGYRDPTL